MVATTTLTASTSARSNIRRIDRPFDTPLDGKRHHVVAYIRIVSDISGAGDGIIQMRRQRRICRRVHQSLRYSRRTEAQRLAAVALPCRLLAVRCRLPGSCCRLFADRYKRHAEI
jgi:hypothetical protein